MDEELLAEIDLRVRQGMLASRSEAIEHVLDLGITTAAQRARFDRECAKFNPAEEQALSEEGYARRPTTIRGRR